MEVKGRPRILRMPEFCARSVAAMAASLETAGVTAVWPCEELLLSLLLMLLLLGLLFLLLVLVLLRGAWCGLWAAWLWL